MDANPLSLIVLILVIVFGAALLLRQLKLQSDNRLLQDQLREHDEVMSRKQQRLDSSLEAGRSLEDQFQAKAQELQSQIHQREQEAAAAQQSLEQARDALRASESNVARLQSEQERAVAGLQSELDDKEQHIARLEQTVSESESARRELEQLRQQVAEQESASAKDRLDELTTRLRIKEQEQLSAQEALQRRDAKVAALSGELERVDEELKQNQAALQERDYLVHHWQERYNKIATEVNQSSQETKEYLRLAHDWKQFADTRDGAVAKLSDELRNAQECSTNERIAYRARNRELARQCDELRTKLNDADRTIEALQQQLQQRNDGKGTAPTPQDFQEVETQYDVELEQGAGVWERSFSASRPARVPLADRRAAIITVLNLEGAAKTDLAANLGVMLGEQGAEVLLVDLDCHRSLTKQIFSHESLQDDLAHVYEERKHVQRFLTGGADADQLEACITPLESTYANVSIVPCSDAINVTGAQHVSALEDVEMQLLIDWIGGRRAIDARLVLSNALLSPAMRDRFDYVLIDCSNHLTAAAVNALVASDYVLFPVDLGRTDAIETIPDWLHRLRRLKEKEVLAQLEILGVAACGVDLNDADKAQTWTELRGHCEIAWGSAVTLFKTGLRDARGLPAADPDRVNLSSLADEIKQRIAQCRTVSQAVES